MPTSTAPKDPAPLKLRMLQTFVERAEKAENTNAFVKKQMRRRV
jgi:hypothetical protein